MVWIRDILGHKGKHLLTVSSQATVYSAAVLMNDHKVGCLLVLEEGRLTGILTERDILHRIVADQRDAGTTPVEEIMTRDVICCRPHTSMEEARTVMKQRRIRHLPVLAESGDIEGIISIGDLNAYHVDSQERTICQLKEYIYGYV